MEEKQKKIIGLEKQITLYSTLGWVFVILAIIPIGEVAIDVFIHRKPWPEVDLGTFLGGVSGTFAALAGVFFVFVAFLGQRISIIQQQIEIQNNIQELRDTREEIKGQKEQLELQNRQFKIQLNSNIFFQLLSNYKNSEAVGKLPIIHKHLNAEFNYMRFEFQDDGYGGVIPIEKKTEFPDEKTWILDKAKNLEESEIKAVSDSMSLLLAILNHVETALEIKENHLKILDLTVSSEEAFSMFYYFVSNSENFHKEDRLLFLKFFKQVRLEVLSNPRHREFLLGIK